MHEIRRKLDEHFEVQFGCKKNSRDIKYSVSSMFVGAFPSLPVDTYYMVRVMT